MKVSEQIRREPQESYPELYLPAGLDYYLCADSVEPKEPIAPEPPVKQEEPSINAFFYIAGFVLVFFLLYKFLEALALLSSASVIISLFASLFITYSIGSRIDEYRRKPIQEKNRLAKEAFDDQKKRYYEANQEFKEETNRFRILGNIEYRNQSIKSFFERNDPQYQPITEEDKVVEGAMDSKFRTFLSDYLIDCHSFLKVVSGYKKECLVESDDPIGCKVFYYYPDIIVSDGKGVLFDIEIDEAYSLETKEPIHYLRSQLGDQEQKWISVDNDRNKAFAQDGWIVLRFSETQVMSHPEECAKTISELYSCLHDYSKFAEYEWRDCLVVPKWDISTAKMLAESDARSSGHNAPVVATF